MPDTARHQPPQPPLGISEQECRALLAAEHVQPHQVLGAHSAAFEGREGVVLRAFEPLACEAQCLLLSDDDRSERVEPMLRIATGGVFAAFVPGARLPLRHRYRFQFADGASWVRGDPYAFAPTIGERDLYFLGEGTHRRLWQVLGAHPRTIEGTQGVAFAVWAPNASRVSVVGDFCAWDGRRFPMRCLGSSGVFELFIPDLKPGALYKFEVRTKEGSIRLKADPMAFEMETPPGTASRIAATHHVWGDAKWMQERPERDPHHQPMAIYEVHLGSWMRVPEQGNRCLTYREVAPRLIEHMKRFGFTHLQLMPVAEHPFGGSWGYQITGYYAPTSRYGSADDFRFLVDLCHQNGIGVILDWVPAHFPKDDHGLRRFDGTSLYEHDDRRLGEHPDWGTLIFNFGRHEVRAFLMANALYWLEEFHVDGLRVDAVASMLYRDYSRDEGEWLPNEYGGRENPGAIEFLKAVNEAVRLEQPGCMMIAEESTAWPGVSRPVAEGGLGFTFKWNMGWMHDTLVYFSKEAIHRRYHQNDLTFALLYEYSERFIMPLSHDEVVHGKGSLLEKMPGDRWQKFANLRLLLAYQYTRPGKKLLFMGTEIAPYREWCHEGSLDWHLADERERQALAVFLEDLGRIYLEYPCLWRRDHEPEGYEWIDHTDHASSVLSYVRRDGARHLLVVLNFTPVPREDYRLGAPGPGRYRELLSSDDRRYWGSDFQTSVEVDTDPIAFHGRPQSLSLRLPPLGALILEPVDNPCVRAAAVGSGSGRNHLRQLAEQCGILPAYWDIEGQTRLTADATCEALLAAMGYDASSERSAARALEQMRALEERCPIDSVRVITQGSPLLTQLPLRIAAGLGGQMQWWVELREEDGTTHCVEGSTDLGPGADRATLVVPVPDGGLAPGYHGLRLLARVAECSFDERQTLIVAPRTCLTSEEVLRGRRVFGLWTHLYAVRSQDNWGIGDLSDLQAMMRWAAGIGAEFVGTNPLHALSGRGVGPSPYFPSSRLFSDPLYLDVTAVPEFVQCKDALQSVETASFRDELAEVQRARRLDYRRVRNLKYGILKRLYRTFVQHHLGRRTQRMRSFRRFCRAQGRDLEDFSVFSALQEKFQDRSTRSGDWRRWPSEYRAPRSAAVERFREECRYEIDFYAYLQFELDRQTAAAQQQATSLGLAIGTYADLALGSAPGGSDAWCFQGLVAKGASVGAPPDAFSRSGQDWGLSPIAPAALRANGYRFWISLLRNACRHAGALRIDHVMGLDRQFWIPQGAQPSAGAYVQYPIDDLLGILALESWRNRTLVIGEDLGTVAESLRDSLRRWGVLRSQVLYFERDRCPGREGAFRRSTSYAPNALVTANTHDLATLPGFWSGRDLEVRNSVGHFAGEAEFAAAQTERAGERVELLRRLSEEGVVPHNWHPSSMAELCRAVYGFLARTPAALLGVSLDDLGGETEAANVPGSPPRYRRNWRRRLRLPLERFAADASVQLALEGVRQRVGR